MECYINIQLMPDAEMPVNRLLNALYSKFHKALCDLKSTSIGVTFPAYKILLGNQIRVHGSAVSLAELQQLNWIGGLLGYCNVSQILTVPSDCKHRIVSRKQTTMSQSKLNRLLKRGSISESEVKAYKAKMFTKGLDNPYVELVSGSNDHKHRRYIEFGDLLDFPQEGQFDQFGLSKTATVPWF
ncbi:type I-F CRISPR-associated endoribonuclease Cas6/Csy4 [Alteromonadaceae bacterium BrNp21-10]|nr:type I-F CRISPR-associated endoribonuclease Cas6/Csy4 [Alteromonadaceae bacterium BrNp21-10]